MLNTECRGVVLQTERAKCFKEHAAVLRWLAFQGANIDLVTHPGFRYLPTQVATRSATPISISTPHARTDARMQAPYRIIGITLLRKQFQRFDKLKRARRTVCIPANLVRPTWCVLPLETARSHVAYTSQGTPYKTAQTQQRTNTAPTPPPGATVITVDFSAVGLLSPLALLLPGCRQGQASPWLIGNAMQLQSRRGSTGVGPPSKIAS